MSLLKRQGIFLVEEWSKHSNGWNVPTFSSRQHYIIAGMSCPPPPLQRTSLNSKGRQSFVVVVAAAVGVCFLSFSSVASIKYMMDVAHLSSTHHSFPLAQPICQRLAHTISCKETQWNKEKRFLCAFWRSVCPSEKQRAHQDYVFFNKFQLILHFCRWGLGACCPLLSALPQIVCPL